MEIDITSKTSRKARLLKLSAEQFAFADLVATGWPEEDAWAVTMRTGMTWNRKALKDEQDKLLATDGVKQRIAEVKNMLSQEQAERLQAKMNEAPKQILERATNKEKKLIELQTLLENGGLQPGSSEYNKINDQIIQVSQMKKDEIKTVDTTILHFLPVHYPLSCKDCLLNPENRRKTAPKNDGASV